MGAKRTVTPYRAFLVAADGKRTRLAAHGIVIELAPGREVELDLAPPAAHAGGLPISTATDPAAAGREGTASFLVVRPGACNVIHLSVEHRPRTGSEPA